MLQSVIRSVRFRSGASRLLEAGRNLVRARPDQFVKTGQRDKREWLCRHRDRPAVAIPRLSLSSTGKVVYTLMTPYRDVEQATTTLPLPIPQGREPPETLPLYAGKDPVLPPLDRQGRHWIVARQRHLHAPNRD